MATRAAAVLATAPILMYAQRMRLVQGISLVVLAVIAAAGCRSSSPEYLPPVFPPPEPPAEPVEREPPSGFLGNPADRVFHRQDCPRTAEIDPARRQFWAWPWEAIDAGYAPCRWCEPMRGWD